MLKTYLAGPISGLSYEESTDWRNYFATLVPRIQCLSPMRGKGYLEREAKIAHDYPEIVLSCQRGIMTRDFFDCLRADAVTVNLLGAKVPSLGTVMEMAWAYQARIPVIAIMEPEGNPHEHPMIRESIGFRVATLEEAAHVLNVVLWPNAADRD